MLLWTATNKQQGYYKAVSNYSPVPSPDFFSAREKQQDSSALQTETEIFMF